MSMRLFLAAILALGPAAPAAAQVRAVSGSVSVVPSFSPALSPAPSLPASVFSAPLAPLLSAPSLAPAPVPALAVSAIPSAAAPPAASVPSALRAGSAPAKAAPRGAPGEKPRDEAARSEAAAAPLAGMAEAAAASAAFDGASAKAPLAAPVQPSRPLGTKSVAVVRVRNVAEARAVIPHTDHFIKELAAKWSGIGWLDVRVYTDARGRTFHALDLSGRPELAGRLPQVMPHEADLIRKIQLHSNDLQLMILEGGKTPDLIVDGVVTEMKSLFPKGVFSVQLAHANEQVLAHATRHRLAPGAAAIDLRGRDAVPVAKLRSDINAYVGTGAAIGLASVSVYAGGERRVFVRGRNGFFDVDGTPKVSRPRSAARRRRAR